MSGASPWDSRAVRAVGLDLMDTLVHDPWREVVEELIGMTVEESRPLRDRTAWGDFELGVIDEQEYARRFFLPGAGRRLDLAALKSGFARGYRFIEGMAPLLMELARRRPVHILSNYPCWYDDVREQLDLDRHVVGHHPSFRLGARKPAAEYFLRVLARTGLAPDGLLFIDDRQDNVAAATALGIRALHFTTAADLRRQVAPLLVDEFHG